MLIEVLLNMQEFNDRFIEWVCLLFHYGIL
jgi:hypothetical protein